MSINNEKLCCKVSHHRSFHYRFVGCVAHPQSGWLTQSFILYLPLTINFQSVARSAFYPPQTKTIQRHRRKVSMAWEWREVESIPWAREYVSCDCGPRAIGWHAIIKIHHYSRTRTVCRRTLADLGILIFLLSYLAFEWVRSLAHWPIQSGRPLFLVRWKMGSQLRLCASNALAALPSLLRSLLDLINKETHQQWCC